MCGFKGIEITLSKQVQNLLETILNSNNNNYNNFSLQ